jgi:DNA invertase Pin-like site-specific DNA recombinase
MRTREGMAIARANGKLCGKPPKLSARQQKHLVDLHDAGEHSIADLAELFSVARAHGRRHSRWPGRLAEDPGPILLDPGPEPEAAGRPPGTT